MLCLMYYRYSYGGQRMKKYDNNYKLLEVMYEDGYFPEFLGR